MFIESNFIKLFFYKNVNSLLAIKFRLNLLSIIERY